MSSRTASVDSFLRWVRKSGLVEESRLDALLRELGQAGATLDDARALADLIVERGWLTRFQADQLRAGKHRGFFLGKYKILELLASGGMSSVYLAEHIHMRRRVAVKVLAPKRVADSSRLARFYREARAVAQLDHPNIVRAYDIDSAPGKDGQEVHFLVTEYVDGPSLLALVRASGPLSPILAAEYARQAALGLEHAFEAGMVHRDVKPSNLLVDAQGTVKLLDLGLARVLEPDEDPESLTRKYDESILGTADYLAPEQALDSHTVDIRADIYSLGCTMYFLLAGHPPFPKGTLAQRLIFHQSREPKPIGEERPDVPAELAGMVMKMMAKRAADRYQTPNEVATALADWLERYGQPIPPRPAWERHAVVQKSGSVAVDRSSGPASGSTGPASASRGGSGSLVVGPLVDPQASNAGGASSTPLLPVGSTAELPALAEPASTAAVPSAVGHGGSDSPEVPAMPAATKPAERPPSEAKQTTEGRRTASARGSGAVPALEQFLAGLQQPAQTPPGKASVHGPAAAKLAEPPTAPPSAVESGVSALSAVAGKDSLAAAGPQSFGGQTGEAAAATRGGAWPSEFWFDVFRNRPGSGRVPHSASEPARARLLSAARRLAGRRWVVTGVGAATLAAAAATVILLLRPVPHGPRSTAADRVQPKASQTMVAAVPGAAPVKGGAGKVPIKVPRKPSRPEVTVKKGGGADFDTVAAALLAVEPGQKIRVLGGGVFEERLVVDGQALEQARGYPVDGVTLEAQPPATIRSPAGADTGPLVTIRDVPRFRFVGFTLDGAGRTGVGLALSGAIRGGVFENLSVEGFRSAGVELRSCVGLVKQEIQLSRVTVRRPESSLSSAVRFAPSGSSGEPEGTSRVVLADCRFDGPFERMLAVDGRVSQLTVIRCLFISGKNDGIVFGGDAAFWSDVRIANSSFFDLTRAIVFRRMLDEASGGLEISNNLFVKVAGPVGMVEKGYDVNRLYPHLTLVGFACNWQVRDSTPSEAIVPGELPLFGDRGHRAPGDLPLDAAQPNFLRPAKSSPLASAGTDSGKPCHVGALAPQ